jgi:hypothetical protein
MYNKIISDRGPQFASKFVKELARLLNYEVALCMAYHPQTDGQTERYNQTLETYLQIYCSRNPDKWEEHVTLTEFTHNSHVHSSMKKVPFEIILGYIPKPLPELKAQSEVVGVQERLEELLKMRKEALAAHKLARQTM